MTRTNTDNALRLHSDSLLSKWGFNDGDMPEAFYDYCEAHGIDYSGIDWDKTLVRLVREFLLPVIEQQVEVYEIETIHNPIRAKTVAGVKVNTLDPGFSVTLTPEYVDVPWSVVVDRSVRDDE